MVRAPAAGRASIPIHRTGCAARSNRSPRRTSSVSCCGGSTSRPAPSAKGAPGVLAVIDQLQGFEIPAGAWEDDVLAARVENYQHRWLEDLCLSGELVWGRFSLRPADPEGEPRRGAATPSRATPVTFALRDDLAWLLQSARGAGRPVDPAHGAARDVLDALRRHGALVPRRAQDHHRAAAGRGGGGLWDLVARGIVTADGFQAVRSLLSARDTWNRRHRHEVRSRVGGRRTATLRQGGEGRWALLPAVTGDEDTDDLAEQVAGQLLARWGVVFWDLTTRENLACRGVTSCGRCDDSRPGASYAAAGSSTGSAASSTRSPRQSRSYCASGAARPRRARRSR